MHNPFKSPTPDDVARRQLLEAQLSLLSHQAAAENLSLEVKRHEDAAEMLLERIQRLSRRLGLHVDGDQLPTMAVDLHSGRR